MFLWFTVGASLFASLGAKFLADQFLTERIPIFRNFAGLVFTENPGVAFGITMPPLVQAFAIGIALVFVAILAIRSAKTRIQHLGFGLIIGGALGNIFDRARDGVVTDFFQIGTFPIFNVADSCITVGVILLLLNTFQWAKAR